MIRKNKNTKILPSVIILTYNEEIHIERCIKSVLKIADKIYIIDSYSSDKTLKICKKFGNKIKIYQHKYINHATQMNWAIKKIPKNKKWILRIDSDEILESNFFNKINLIKNINEFNGINIIIEHLFLGKKIRYGGVYPQYQIRLWKRKYGKYDNKPMDEKLILKKQNIFNSQIKIIDWNLKGILFWFKKHYLYAQRESELFFKIKKKVIQKNKKDKKLNDKILYYKYPIFFRVFALVLYRFIIKKSFLDGLIGFKFCLMQTLYYRLLIDSIIFFKYLNKSYRK